MGIPNFPPVDSQMISRWILVDSAHPSSTPLSLSPKLATPPFNLIFTSSPPDQFQSHSAAIAIFAKKHSACRRNCHTVQTSTVMHSCVASLVESGLYLGRSCPICGSSGVHGRRKASTLPRLLLPWSFLFIKTLMNALTSTAYKDCSLR